MWASPRTFRAGSPRACQPRPHTRSSYPSREIPGAAGRRGFSFPPFGCGRAGSARHLEPMKDAIVEFGGYRIRVRSRGAARGPHALVLAGMGETAFTVEPQTRALRDLGYTTHVIELPG